MTDSNDQEEWEGDKIVQIYNNSVEGTHSIAEGFANSKYGYVVEARYFVKEGLDALRDKGYQINHSEVRAPVGEDEEESRVQLSIEWKSGGDSSTTSQPKEEHETGVADHGNPKSGNGVEPPKPEPDAALVKKSTEIMQREKPKAVRLKDKSTTIYGIRDSVDYSFEQRLFSISTINEIIDQADNLDELREVFSDE